MSTTTISLNCQKNYHPDLRVFLESLLTSAAHDFILLQEATSEIQGWIQKSPHYTLLSAHDPHNKPALVCIAYKKEIRLDSTSFTPFSAGSPADDALRLNRPHGIITGLFTIGTHSLSVSSVHLVSGFKPRLRRKQLIHTLKHLESLRPVHTTLFGGDFNFSLPGEIARADILTHARFVRTTTHIGSTLDTYYTESSQYLANRLVALLRLFGMRVCLHTDHLFVDTKTNKHKSIQAQARTERVSDHLPIELIITD